VAGHRLFGTDGVRGHANTELTADLAFGLARAAGEQTTAPVVIGRDTRRSGPMLVAALHAGFNSVGVDTVELGIVPVGAVSRLTREVGAGFGVMVSASHNPAEDNGIKFFASDGAKLSDDAEDAIAERYRQGGPWKTPGGGAIGIQTSMMDAVDRYLEYIMRPTEYSLRGIELVLDCANGAAFKAAPELFTRLGATVESHNVDPDGMNINKGCGATHPEALAGLSGGRVGFAFDGDADRLIAVDEEGVVADGDVLMAIFANHLKERGKLKNDLVVATVMSNLGFHRAMAELGIEVAQTQVGDRYVLEEMRRTRAVLGGEQSGHILLEDRATGDGLRSAIRLAEIMAGTGKPLTELRKIMTTFPQVLENVRVENKSLLEGATPIWDAVRAAESRLAGEGRILVRASGTEPVVRVMVEASTRQAADAAAGAIVDVVKRELGDSR
jgi:phosphoglucosamine mutase